MFKKLVLAVALSGLVGTAVAEPVRFDFTFQENHGPARATGYIVFETDLIANPGVNDIGLPNAAVLDLSVTVSGATSGNGASSTTLRLARSTARPVPGGSFV